MDTRLEFYVKTVMNHVLSSEYADCLYSYDVVNEYLHSVNAEKDSKNITYWGLIYGTYDKSVKDHGVTLRPSYVKDAFKYAHEMLVKYDRTDVKLIYNDYNCYQNPENIIHLVDYINSDGKVCDGIGMQSFVPSLMILKLVITSVPSLYAALGVIASSESLRSSSH